MKSHLVLGNYIYSLKMNSFEECRKWLQQGRSVCRDKGSGSCSSQLRGVDSLSCVMAVVMDTFCSLPETQTQNLSGFLFRVTLVAGYSPLSLTQELCSSQCFPSHSCIRYILLP